MILLFFTSIERILISYSGIVETYPRGSVRWNTVYKGDSRGLYGDITSKERILASKECCQ